MEGYAKEGRHHVLFGRQPHARLADRPRTLRKNYDSRAKMGTLAFSELELKPLSPFYTMVTVASNYARERRAPHGRFTLILRRTNAAGASSMTTRLRLRVGSLEQEG